MVDTALAALDRHRTVLLTLPHFSAVAESELIAALPERLARVLVARLGLEIRELPVELAPLTLPLYWHRRRDCDAAHAWLREQLVQASTSAP